MLKIGCWFSPDLFWEYYIYFNLSIACCCNKWKTQLFYVQIFWVSTTEAALAETEEANHQLTVDHKYLYGFCNISQPKRFKYYIELAQKGKSI